MGRLTLAERALNQLDRLSHHLAYLADVLRLF